MGESNLTLEKGGFMTMCHNELEEKKGLSKHTHEPSLYIDRVLISGKKWEVLHIKL